MAERTLVKNLQRFFGIKVKTSGEYTQTKTVVPAKYNSDTNRHELVKMSSDIQKFYDYWVSNYDNYESLSTRFSRYKDLEFCALNSGIIGFAHELYTDETVNADENGEIIQVTAKQKKVEKYIRELFERIGVQRQSLHAASDDLALYSDHFWALNIQEGIGIEEITPLSVYQIKDRLEYNGLKIASEIAKHRGQLLKAANRDARMSAMVQAVDKISSDDYAAQFKNYLFGFEMDTGQIIAPWNIIHFRRFDTKSEFAPFGKPLFLKSIARFRQLKALENLIAMLRASKFPREVFSVQLDETMPETEKWAKLQEAQYEYLSSGNMESGSESELDVGAPIWVADGLVSFDLKEARVNLDDLGDLEAIQEDLALSTSVPQGYYNPNKSSFGNSGQALLQQYKPFGRKVYHNQTALLDGLIHLVKLQFAITGDFPVDEDFELTMTFPVTEETRDQVSMKNDTLRLAKDVLDNIGQAIGLDRGEALPRDVVKDVFTKLSFLSYDDIDSWMKAIETAEEEAASEGEEGGDEFDFFEKARNKVKRLKEETVRSAYFKAKRDRMITEGTSVDRHFKTSRSSDPVNQRIYEHLSNFSGSQRLEEQTLEVEGPNRD